MKFKSNDAEEKKFSPGRLRWWEMFWLNFWSWFWAFVIIACVYGGMGYYLSHTTEQWSQEVEDRQTRDNEEQFGLIIHPQNTITTDTAITALKVIDTGDFFLLRFDYPAPVRK